MGKWPELYVHICRTEKGHWQVVHDLAFDTTTLYLVKRHVKLDT